MVSRSRNSQVTFIEKRQFIIISIQKYKIITVFIFKRKIQNNNVQLFSFLKTRKKIYYEPIENIKFDNFVLIGIC